MAENPRSRRGRGDGTIFWRCGKAKCRGTDFPEGRRAPRCPKCGSTEGKWTGQVSLGYKPDGSRNRPTFYGDTREQVRLAIQKARAADSEGQLPADPSKETVGAYLERWLKFLELNRKVRANTLADYRCLVRLFAGSIARIQLKKLEPIQIQDMYTKLLEAGRSPRRVETLHAVLSGAFSQAVQWKLLRYNPASGAEAPKPAKKEQAVLTLEQTAKLNGVLRQDPYFALYHLAMETGARRSEILGLKWRDIDLTKGTISINRGAVIVPTTPEEEQATGRKRKVVLLDPKTEASKGIVAISLATVAVLKQHRDQQRFNRRALEQAGGAYQDQDLVFCRASGTPHDPGHISQHWALLLQKAGLPHVKLHAGTRHTHATQLLEAGVHPRVVQNRLRQSSITVTMDTYSHVLPHMQAEALAKLDAHRGRASSEASSAASATKAGTKKTRPPSQ